jgi:hypothetical protein
LAHQFLAQQFLLVPLVLPADDDNRIRCCYRWGIASIDKGTPTVPAHKPRSVEVFISYSHKDENLKEKLDVHLSTLKRQGVIRVWHDRKITPGQQFTSVIGTHLNSADIVLLLVSADFVDSDYCYGREMTRALERHDNREAIVIPVILRPCDWKSTPFGKLQVLPKNARPVTDWPNRDKAFAAIVEGIREAVERLRTREPGSEVERTRRVDAVAPSSARVGVAIDLLVQVQVPHSPHLGLRDWPLAPPPVEVVSDSKQATLLFPQDVQTGRIGAARLVVRVIAPDFVINSDVEKVLLVPPSQGSEIASFLLTPQRPGQCRINVEVLDLSRTQLGNIFITTSVQETDSAPTAAACSLELEVRVAPDFSSNWPNRLLQHPEASGRAHQDEIDRAVQEASIGRLRSIPIACWILAVTVLLVALVPWRLFWLHDELIPTIGDAVPTSALPSQQTKVGATWLPTPSAQGWETSRYWPLRRDVEHNESYYRKGMEQAKELGVTVLRIRLWEEAGPLFDAEGTLVNYDERFRRDVRRFLDMANEHGLEVEFCLLHYQMAAPWKQSDTGYDFPTEGHGAILTDSRLRKLYRQEFLEPFLKEFGSNPAWTSTEVLAASDMLIGKQEGGLFEVGGELQPTDPILKKHVRDFLKECSEVIKKHKQDMTVTATVNSGCTAILEGLTLDRYTLLYLKEHGKLEYCVSELSGERPWVLECDSENSRALAASYLREARRRGAAGVFFWNLPLGDEPGPWYRLWHWTQPPALALALVAILCGLGRKWLRVRFLFPTEIQEPRREMHGASGTRFCIAISFSGEHRAFVGQVAERLAARVGRDRVLYDTFHEAEFARPDLDVYLPQLYREQSELLVLFLCPEYQDKQWCRLEWRHIRQLVASVDARRIMLVSFGPPGDLSHLGILPGDGYVDIDNRSADDIAGLILNRLASNAASAVTSPSTPPTAGGT